MPTFCDPCPGKMKAITGGTPRAAAMSCSTRSMKRSAAKRYAIATALRTALALERPWPTIVTPADAEQRRAAVFRVVHAPAEAPERAPRQQRSDAHRDRARQLLAQQRLDHLDQALADLQRHVAGEPVADDDVGVAAVDVARLDVADEVERRGLQQPVRLARQLVALASLPRRSTAGRPAATSDAERHARVDARPSPRTAAGAAAGTPRSRRRRAGPPGGAASESSPPAPADRRPATCRTPRARP